MARIAKYKDEFKQKKRRKLFFRLMFWGCVCVVGLVGVAYLLFFAKVFDIRTVEIQASDELHASLSDIVKNWLDEEFWKLTRRNNILLISADALARQLVADLPKLEFIAVDVDFPHGLILSAVERKPVGVWCPVVQGRCFYFDKEGVAFDETKPSAGFLITVINDYRHGKTIELGDRVAATDWLGNIIKARDLLAKADIDISGFFIPADSFDEFHAQTADGWTIMFSIQTDVEKQIHALATFMKEKLTPGQKSNLQYVDLRIQNRIYYK